MLKARELQVHTLRQEHVKKAERLERAVQRARVVGDERQSSVIVGP